MDRFGEKCHPLQLSQKDSNPHSQGFLSAHKNMYACITIVFLTLSHVLRQLQGRYDPTIPNKVHPVPAQKRSSA